MKEISILLAWILIVAATALQSCRPEMKEEEKSKDKRYYLEKKGIAVAKDDLQPLNRSEVLKAEDIYKALETDDLDYEVLEPLIRFEEDPCCLGNKRPDNQMDRWPPFGSGNKEINWYMDERHSGLEKAFDLVYKNTTKQVESVKIALIDTGYDPRHPAFGDDRLQRNIVKQINLLGTPKDSAFDDLKGRKGFQLMNYGHGSGTMGLIAIDKINIEGKSYRIGGNPNAKLVVIRATYGSPLFIQNTVRESIDAFKKAIEEECDIISFSHGGIISGRKKRKFDKIIKEAHDKGIVVVTAAGNNHLGVTLYGTGRRWIKRKLKKTADIADPAKHSDKYTIAVSAVTYDLKPYTFDFYPDMPDNSDCILEHMQLSWGRDDERDPSNIIAAYSPNIPSIKIGTKDFKFNMGGTSASVPQVASAVSLYIAKYKDELNRYTGSQKVSIIKKALFESARKNKPEYGINPKLFVKYLGNGMLDAVNMMNYSPNKLVDNISPIVNPEVIESINEFAIINMENFTTLPLLFPEFSFEKAAQRLINDNRYNIRQLEFLDYIIYNLYLEDEKFSILLEDYNESKGTFLADEKQKALFKFLKDTLDSISKDILKELEARSR